MIQPRTNENCFPWYCPMCERSGVVTMEDPNCTGHPPMPGEITNVILKVHETISPRCRGAIVLAPAENWYAIIPRRKAVTQ
jgi:hypothetical protein